MKPIIGAARRACELIGARQVVVVAFDADGRYAVLSYGETKAECSAVRPVCDAIADALDSGRIEGPSRVATTQPRPAAAVQGRLL